MKNKNLKDIDEKKLNNDSEDENEILSIVEAVKGKMFSKNGFLSVFFAYLKADKVYLCAFIICVLFLTFASINKVILVEEEEVVVPKQEETVNALSIQDYVGLYSRVVELDEAINVNDSCLVDSYKIVYQIKKDGVINKYFYNSCIGSALISSENLDYMYDGTVRFIGTENYSYQFGTNYLKEVDGDSYDIDDDLFSIKENIKISGVKMYFYGSNIILKTNDNLLMMNDKETFSVSGHYPSYSGNIDIRFYESMTKYQFNFIVFNDEDGLSCVDGVDSLEKAYTIYSIRFDVNSNNFLDAKEIVSRTKSDGCQFWNDDLKLLKE